LPLLALHNNNTYNQPIKLGNPDSIDRDFLPQGLSGSRLDRIIQLHGQVSKIAEGHGETLADRPGGHNLDL